MDVDWSSTDICNWASFGSEKNDLQQQDSRDSDQQQQNRQQLEDCNDRISQAIATSDEQKRDQKKRRLPQPSPDKSKSEQSATTVKRCNSTTPLSSPAEELPPAKAVTFSASTIKASPTRQTSPAMKSDSPSKLYNQQIYDAESNDDFNEELPAADATYQLRPSTSPRDGNLEAVNPNDVTMQVNNLSPASGRLNIDNPRDRTNTLESELTSDSSVGSSTFGGGFSKKMLINLMKEQVNLVRDLTNAQIANKKELEKMKEEKERLEREAKEREAGLGPLEAKAFAAAGHSDVPQANQSDLKQQYERTHPGGRHTKLNLPENVQRDTSDSRSVSSRSLFDRFRRPHHGPPGSRYHPDAKYYVNRNRAFSGDTYGDGTQNNVAGSMASTILPTQIMVGQESPGVQYTGPQMAANYYNKDKIQITPIPERNVVPPEKKTCATSLWWFFSRLVTLFIPDLFLCCIGRHAKYSKGMTVEQKAEVKKAKGEAKQAWREKVGIFVIMILCSAAFIGVSGVIPILLCRETTVFVSSLGSMNFACT